MEIWIFSHLRLQIFIYLILNVQFFIINSITWAPISISQQSYLLSERCCNVPWTKFEIYILMSLLFISSLQFQKNVFPFICVLQNQNSNFKNKLIMWFSIRKLLQQYLCTFGLVSSFYRDLQQKIPSFVCFTLNKVDSEEIKIISIKLQTATKDDKSRFTTGLQNLLWNIHCKSSFWSFPNKTYFQ